MTRYAMMLAALLGLAACNTTAGFGEDLQQTGETVEETAEETASGI